MNFVKLPENGASWAESLCYTIDTESSEPQDLVVEILDRYGGSVIGTKRLYSVTVAEIDIAPYVRSAVSERSTEKCVGRYIVASGNERSVACGRRGVRAANTLSCGDRLFHRANVE